MNINLNSRLRVVGSIAIAVLISTGVLIGRSQLSGAAPVKRADVAVELQSATVDGGTVTVAVRVNGGDELGPVLSGYNRPRLTSGDGTVTWATRSWGDLSNTRLLSAEFSYEVVKSETLILSVGDFGFQSEADFERMRTGETVPTTRVEGDWSVEVTVAPDPAVRHVQLHESADFGPGTMSVTGAVLSSDRVTLSGHISGLTWDQFPDLLLAPAVLTANGEPAAFRGGRSGFGSDRGSFELSFDLPEADEVVLSVPFGLSGVTSVGSTANPEAIEPLRQYAGTSATLTLDLR